MKRPSCPLCGAATTSKSRPEVDGATIVVAGGLMTMVVHRPTFKLKSVRKEIKTNER